MQTKSGELKDSHGRTIRDLRVSLTDRCNFRCFYCLPQMDTAYAHKDKILTYEEIVRAASVFVSLGVTKVRLTGGEPMLRRDIEFLVAELNKLRDEGLGDIALTTNGHEITKKAGMLREAGLDRITISLDSLKRERFREITGADKLEEVLQAIEAAGQAGLNPVKVNAVIVRGHNDDEIEDFADFAREYGVSMRFIEYMPLDSGHDWDRSKVVSGREIKERISGKHPLRLNSESRNGSTAWNFRFADGGNGEIGIIAPVTEMFCGECSRLRLTADGQIRTCLFSTEEHDLRGVLRSEASRDEIVSFIRKVTLTKEASHGINSRDFVQPARTMSFIGG